MLRVAILCLLLTACTEKQILRGSGKPIDAPYGYTIGCINNPDAIACKGDK